MEELSMTPTRRAYVHDAYGRHAFDPRPETVAWRAPASPRFDGRPANDWTSAFQSPITRPAIDEGAVDQIPRWVVLLGGAFIAAILGALLGGAMQV